MGIFDRLNSLVRGRKEEAAAQEYMRVITDKWAEKYGVQHPLNFEQYGMVYGASAWVYICVSAIATQASDADFKLFENKKDKQEEITDQEHPILSLFNRINDNSVSSDFYEGTLTSLELQGNAYWYIVRDRLGIPRAMYFMRPDWTVIVPDTNDGVQGFLYGPDRTKQVAFEKQEVMHIKYFNPTNYYYGHSPITSARIAIESDLYAAGYTRNFFKNSARPDGVLRTEADLSDPEYRKLRKRWGESHQGVDNAYRTAILTGGMDYKLIGINQKDADFIAQMKFMRETILAVLKVPPAIVGIFEYANYANAEMQKKIFWANVLTKKLNKIAEYINADLILPTWGTKYTVKYDYTNVEALKENLDTIHTRARDDYKAGLVTRNEARRIIGMDDTPDGDVFVSVPQPTQGKGLILKKKFDLEKIHILAKNLDQKREGRIKLIREEWQNALSKLFADQKKRFMAEFKRQLQKKDIDWSKVDVQAIIDKGEYTEEIAVESEKYIEKCMDEGFKHAEEISRTGLVFGINAPEVTNIRENILSKLVSNTNPTTVETLRTAIEQAFIDKLTATELTRHIETIWEGWQGYRAERIARTEAANAFGTSSFLYYKKAGIQHKIWMTMGDEKVSLTCTINEGQGEIPMDEAFESGDYHEPGHVNCRCSVVPAYIGQGELTEEKPKDIVERSAEPTLQEYHDFSHFTEKEQVEHLREYYLKAGVSYSDKEIKEMIDAANGFTSSNYGIIRSYQVYETTGKYVGPLEKAKTERAREILLKEGKKQSELLEKYLAAVKPYEQKYIARGIGISPEVVQKTGLTDIKPGSTINMSGSASWSRDAEVAMRFSKTGYRDERICFLVENKTGVDVKLMSAYDSEREVVSSRETCYEVIAAGHGQTPEQMGLQPELIEKIYKDLEPERKGQLWPGMETVFREYLDQSRERTHIYLLREKD